MTSRRTAEDHRDPRQQYENEHANETGVSEDAVNAGQPDHHERTALNDMTERLEHPRGDGTDLWQLGISERDALNGAKMLRGDRFDEPLEPRDERKALDAVGVAFQDAGTGDDRRAAADRAASQVMESQFPGQTEHLNDVAQMKDTLPEGLRDSLERWNSMKGVDARISWSEDHTRWTVQIDCKDEASKKQIQRDMEHMGLTVRDIGKGQRMKDDDGWEILGQRTEAEDEKFQELKTAAGRAHDEMVLKRERLANMLENEAAARAENPEHAGLAGGGMKEVLDQARDELAEYYEVHGTDREATADYDTMMKMDNQYQNHHLERRVSEDFAGAAQLVSTNQFEAIREIEQEQHQRAELAAANGTSLEDAPYTDGQKAALDTLKIADDTAERLKNARTELVGEALEALRNGDEATYTAAIENISTVAERIENDMTTALEDGGLGYTSTDAPHVIEWAAQSQDPDVQISYANYQNLANTHRQMDAQGDVHAASIRYQMEAWEREFETAMADEYEVG